MSVLFPKLESLLLKLQLLRAELDEQGARTPSGAPPNPGQPCSQVCLAFTAASFSQEHVGPDIPHLCISAGAGGEVRHLLLTCEMI